MASLVEIPDVALASLVEIHAMSQGPLSRPPTGQWGSLVETPPDGATMGLQARPRRCTYHAHVHACASARTYMDVHMHMYIHMYMSMYMHMHACKQTYTL